MNNIRNDVFKCLKDYLDNRGWDTDTHKYLRVLVDETLNEIAKNKDKSSHQPYKMTRQDILGKITRERINSDDAKEKVDMKKVEQEIEKIKNYDCFKQLGFYPVLKTDSGGGRGKHSYYYLDIVEHKKASTLNQNCEEKDENCEKLGDKKENIDYNYNHNLYVSIYNIKREYHKNDLNLIFKNKSESNGSINYQVTYQRKEGNHVKPSFIFNLFLKDKKIKMRSVRGISIFILLGSSFFIFIALFLYLILEIIKLFLNANLNFITFSIYCMSLIIIYKIFLNFFIPIDNLIHYRIIKAPMFFIGFNVMNAELECYLDADNGYKIYHLIEITSTCPICTAPIILAEGKPDQKAPLVGRCKEAPHAHVYSFDRMTMKGYFLGHQGYLTDTDLN